MSSVWLEFLDLKFLYRLEADFLHYMYRLPMMYFQNFVTSEQCDSGQSGPMGPMGAAPAVCWKSLFQIAACVVLLTFPTLGNHCPTSSLSRVPSCISWQGSFAAILFGGQQCTIRFLEDRGPE